ncbi:unnamed protein product [Orchesella dallaii]|uniref:Uncharacterized protein n=1 Tax=Orchesella dallaii TaxID=48710 RepID=A0ABP1RI03_9HEXA
MENKEVNRKNQLQQTSTLSSLPSRSAAASSNSNNISNAAHPSQHQRHPAHSIPITPSSPPPADSNIQKQHNLNMASSSTNVNFETTFQCLGKSIDEANKNNLYLNGRLQSEKSSLKTCKKNEILLRKMLGELQQKYKTKEQENIELNKNMNKLRDALKSLENNPESVPKVQYDDVMAKNKTISKNNERVRKQNEELMKKAKEQQEQLFKLRDKNEKLIGENEIFGEENFEFEKKLEQEKHDGKKLFEKYKTMEGNLQDQKVILKNLEGKLAQAQNTHKTEVAQLRTKISEMNIKILEANMKLTSSCDQINSLMKENVSFANKIESLKVERQALQKWYKLSSAKIKKNHNHVERNVNGSITAKNKEVGRLNVVLDQLRITLKNKNESIKNLQGELEKLKKKSEFQLEKQLKSESGRACQANVTKLDLKNEIEKLTKRCNNQKVQLDRKTKGLANLKRISADEEKAKNEANLLANKLILEASILKQDRDGVNYQLKLRLDENRKLQSERDLLQEKLGGLNKVAKEVEKENEKLQKILEDSAALLQTREAQLTGQMFVIKDKALEESELKIFELEQEVEQLQRKLNEEEFHHEEELHFIWLRDVCLDVTNPKFGKAHFEAETDFSNPLELEEISSEDELFEETPAKRWKSA